jgi:hypothetical protein
MAILNIALKKSDIGYFLHATKWFLTGNKVKNKATRHIFIGRFQVKSCGRHQVSGDFVVRQHQFLNCQFAVGPRAL